MAQNVLVKNSHGSRARQSAVAKQSGLGINRGATHAQNAEKGTCVRGKRRAVLAPPKGVQNCRKRYQVVVHQAKVVLIIPSRKEKETNSARRKRFDSGRSSTQAQRHTLKQDNGAVTTLSTQCPMKRIRRNKVTRARAARRPQRDLNYEPAGTTGAWGPSKQLP